MKTLTTVVLLFFLSKVTAQQNGIAYYVVNSSQEIESKEKIQELDPELRSAINATDESLKEVEFKLIFNEEFGKYQDVKKMSSDNDSELALGMAKIIAGYLGPVHYNLKDQQIISERRLGNQSFLVNKVFDDYSWVLTNESIKINNLICYKATTSILEEKRSGIKETLVIAWYTPEISIPIGPNGFAGLPGLIVQIENKKTITTLKKIQFIKDSELEDLRPPANIPYLSNEEYKQKLKTFLLNRN